jgi:CheY-like chemotaxis protein
LLVPTVEIKKKILVMDDEEMVGDIACQMLDFLGYEAKWVKNGEETLQEYRAGMAAGKPFAAVILDLTIPVGMGGKEAAGALLDLDPSVKIFVASGYSTDPIMLDHQGYGFAGVIAKPFDIAAIQQLLAAVL